MWLPLAGALLAEAQQAWRTGAASSPLSACPGAVWSGPQRTRKELYHPHGPQRGQHGLAWGIRSMVFTRLSHSHPNAYPKSTPLSPALLPGAHLSKWHHPSYLFICALFIRLLIHSFSK